MTQQIFYLKHAFEFDVDKLVTLFIERAIFKTTTVETLAGWRVLLSEILRYLQTPNGCSRNTNEYFIAEATIQSQTINLTITNCGFPVEMREFRDKFKHATGVAITSNSDDRSGQKISISFQLDEQSQIFSQQVEDRCDLQALHVRELKSGEEYLVSKLFYNVYRYRYINPGVYDPEIIALNIAQKKLVSYVGVSEAGQIVSHVGLVLVNEDPKVYEAAWGVVDPAFANRGIFRQTFEAALEHMQKLSMSYSIYDFVTNHDFSQRLVSKYGYKDLAIFVGNQVSETQARLPEKGQFDQTSEQAGMERYSLLLGIDTRGEQPFGARIALPVNIGETCDFLLANMGMSWEPTNRFESLPVGGRYTAKIQHEQKSVLFDLYDVGRDAVERILVDLSHHLRSGLEYAAVDFPLNVPGVGYIHDALADAGFFMSGIVPYRFTNQLGFRMQFLTPTDLDFDAIKIHSPIGKRLLQIVKDEWERNHLI